jgi:hypothetical protein
VGKQGLESQLCRQAQRWVAVFGFDNRCKWGASYVNAGRPTRFLIFLRARGE